MIIHSAIDDAHEHRPRPEQRIVDLIVPRRVGLHGLHRLHAALQLDEDHVNARCGLARGSVANGAAHVPACARDGDTANAAINTSANAAQRRNAL